MELKELFWVFVMSIIVLGGCLVIVNFVEKSDNTFVCSSPSIKIGNICCQDLDFNGICDSHQLKAMNDIEAQKQQVEIAQLKSKVSSLQSDVEYYKNNYEAERRIRIYHDDDDDEFTVKVIVEDEDGYEIEDAYVRLVGDDYSDTEYTDDDGEARFKNVEEDCYDIKVRKDGYESETEYECFDESDTIRIYLEEE